MTRILLKFSKEHINQPITSQIILEQKVSLTILRANVEPTHGEILIEVPQENTKQVINAFKEKGVTVSVQRRLEVDEEKCISCGACYSLCPISVISLDKNHAITFDEEKCISCGLCVDACPTRALRI